MKQGHEILVGRQPVLEVLRAGRRRVFKILVAHGTRHADVVAEILDLARRGQVPLSDVAPHALDGMAAGANHQGFAAEVSDYPYADLADLPAAAVAAGEPPFLLLLDRVQDPQNLGSLLRSAEAAGVHGVVIPKHDAAAITPAAVRASAGAAEHMRVAKVTNLAQAMRELKDLDVRLAGVEAVPEATPFTDADLTGPLGLVLGSEGEGLGRLVRETCDILIRLPMFGRVSSLNVGAAGAVSLYEVRRQRAAAAIR